MKESNVFSFSHRSSWTSFCLSATNLKSRTNRSHSLPACRYLCCFIRYENINNLSVSVYWKLMLIMCTAVAGGRRVTREYHSLWTEQEVTPTHPHLCAAHTGKLFISVSLCLNRKAVCSFKRIRRKIIVLSTPLQKTLVTLLILIINKKNINELINSDYYWRLKHLNWAPITQLNMWTQSM